MKHDRFLSAVNTLLALLLLGAVSAAAQAPMHPAAGCDSGNVPNQIAADTTLEGALFVTGDVRVRNGATLTLLPGATVIVCGPFTIYIGEQLANVAGGLVAVGTPAAPITFDAATPAQHWSGLVFASYLRPSILQHVAIRRGGGNDPAAQVGALTVEQAFADSSYPTVDRVSISDSGAYGIRVLVRESNRAPPALRNLAITGSASAPLLLSAPAVPGLGGGNDLSGNAIDTIRVGGGQLEDQLRFSQTWRRQPAPFEL